MSSPYVAEVLSVSIFSITIYPVLLGKLVALVNPIVVAESVISPDKVVSYSNLSIDTPPTISFTCVNLTASPADLP